MLSVLLPYRARKNFFGQLTEYVRNLNCKGEQWLLWALHTKTSRHMNGLQSPLPESDKYPDVGTSPLQDTQPPMIRDFTFAVVALLLTFVGYHQRRKSRLSLPPGPKGYPVVGNLFELPSQQQWIKFLEWSNEYNSDIIYFRVFGRSTIILNSLKATNDLLGARSLIYSDRPRNAMLLELLGWAPLLSFMAKHAVLVCVVSEVISQYSTVARWPQASSP
ncbi:hypothetical protein AB1N83_007767 [Pleurotus pulmonarius]